MATVVHCLYCFETLAASLEHRQTLTLGQIEEYWEPYVNLRAREIIEKKPGNASEMQNVVSTEVEDSPNVHTASSHPWSMTSFSSEIPHLPARFTAPDNSAASSSSSLSNMSMASSLRTTESPLSSRSSLSPASAPSAARAKDISHAASRQQVRHPMFVTWNTVSTSGQKRLRGCIGTFEALELEHGLRTYALTAAFEDTRFPRIQILELPSLECSVTLLTDFETAANPLAWEIGVHGLRISFTHHTRRYGATYLPDVALEQGWTKVETLVSLMRKAGWRGRSSEWQKVSDLNVVRYQGQRVTAKNEDWRSFYEWMTTQQR